MVLSLWEDLVVDSTAHNSTFARANLLKVESLIDKNSYPKGFVDKTGMI
jgi:hypothetical protein